MILASFKKVENSSNWFSENCITFFCMLIGNNFKFMFAIIHCRSSSNKFNFEIRMAHLGFLLFHRLQRKRKKKLWEVHILFWGCIAIHPSTSIHTSWGRMISRCVFSAFVEEDVGSFGLKMTKKNTNWFHEKKIATAENLPQWRFHWWELHLNHRNGTIFRHLYFWRKQCLQIQHLITILKCNLEFFFF